MSASMVLSWGEMGMPFHNERKDVSYPRTIGLNDFIGPALFYANRMFRPMKLAVEIVQVVAFLS
jgi:hypothetical protein